MAASADMSCLAAYRHALSAHWAIFDTQAGRHAHLLSLQDRKPMSALPANIQQVACQPRGCRAGGRILNSPICQENL